MILTLDADDWIAPTMLRECVALLEADPALGVAYTDTFYCHEFGQVQMHAAGEFSVAALRENNRLNCCSLYRRKVWTKVGGYRTNVRGYDDWDFWLAAAAAGFTGKRVAKPLFFYRAKGTGVFSETVADDKLRRARIKLNNPSCYPAAERAQAEALIAAEQKGRTAAPAPAVERPDPPRQAAAVPSALRGGLVSVVIPCYRQAEFLRDAVDSVIAQTYPQWEIIIVNDGSPDDTSAVAQAIILARPGHTIRLVEKKNGGLSASPRATIFCRSMRTTRSTRSSSPRRSRSWNSIRKSASRTPTGCILARIPRHETPSTTISPGFAQRRISSPARRFIGKRPGRPPAATTPT
jgi:GT2 family glycosyltransferase